MKLLTTEQLVYVLKWVYVRAVFAEMHTLDCLITAECREHGYAGIEDAYRVLIEEKTR